MPLSSLPIFLLSLCIAAAAADPQKSYTADSKLTDQLPDRSSKGDGPKASQTDHFIHSNIVTLYLQLRCNACGVVSLELEEAISEARCARRNTILVLFFVMTTSQEEDRVAAIGRSRYGGGPYLKCINETLNPLRFVVQVFERTFQNRMSPYGLQLRSNKPTTMFRCHNTRFGSVPRVSAV